MKENTQVFDVNTCVEEYLDTKEEKHGRVCVVFLSVCVVCTHMCAYEYVYKEFVD